MAAPQESKTIFYGPNVRVVTPLTVLEAKKHPVSPVPAVESTHVSMSPDLRSGVKSIRIIDSPGPPAPNT